MDDFRWQAIVSNDILADGSFCYGVVTTGVFCRPSCKSKLPLRENVLFFDSPGQALVQGFRPCKRCRPDLAAYAPIVDWVGEVKGYLVREAGNPQCLRGLKEFNLSSSHLARVFRVKFGVSPREFLLALRVERAKTMLRGSDLRILEIALQCGFGSYAAFYTAFRARTGVSPKDYRRRNV